MPLFRPLATALTARLARQHVDFNAPCLKGCQFVGEADGPNLFNGATVSRLSDQSANRAHAEQAVATNQPVFVASVASLNNKPALQFAGNDDLRFSGSGLDLFRNVRGFTGFFIAKVDNFAALQFFLFASIGTNTTATRVSMFPQTNRVLWGGVRRLDTDGGSAGSGGSVTSTDPFLFEMVMDFDATTLRLYKDGALIYENTTFSTPGATSDTPSLGIAIGSGNGANYFSGLMAAVCIYRRALTSVERAYIRQGLGKKYGIPTS